MTRDCTMPCTGVPRPEVQELALHLRHECLGAPTCLPCSEDVPAVVTKMEVTLSADARALGPKVAGSVLLRT